MRVISGLFKILAVVVFLLPALAVPSRADYYSYVDSSGVVHFTNVPTSAKFKWLMSETAPPRPTPLGVGAPKGGSGGINGYSKAKPYARRGASYDTLINNISSTYGIETALVKAIIKVESDFDTYAVSEDGAAGLMQLMPETAAKMGVKDIHDPGQNVRGGVKFFKKLLGTFKSDLRLALAAYNAGENAVLKYGKVPPYPETRNYVEKVLRYRDQYKKASG